MAKTVRHKFILRNHRKSLAETVGVHATHFLPEVQSHNRLLDDIVHEDIHIEINRATHGRTTEKQDHWIMARMEIDWF